MFRDIVHVKLDKTFARYFSRAPVLPNILPKSEKVFKKQLGPNDGSPGKA